MAKKKKEIVLVDIEFEEIEQFSRNLIKIDENFMKTSITGVVQSIFHEFLVKFQIRQTVFAKRVFKILLLTNAHKYVLNIDKKFTKILVDGVYTLKIDNSGQVFSPKGKTMFASFLKENNGGRVMRFNDTIIASVGDFDAVSGRYFGYVNNQLKKEQYWMLVLLASWDILKD